MVSRFTGEDTIEFHVHGGSAIIAAMYDSLAAFPEARIAEPGEFTKRAFYAGKMDLTEVEGLADLIHAETEAQRRQALRQANGQLATFYNGMRAQLVKVIAGVEAYIDFAEDQDVDDGVLEGSVTEVRTLIEELKAHLNDNRRGERLRDGVRTAIVGAPNVGKSSLINLLSQRNVSIVTSIAGTTRDIVESHYDIGGYPVVLADTAGLRSKTDDVIESEGIVRAKAYVESADFVVFVIDASRIDCHDHVDSYVEQYIASIGLDKALLGSGMVVFNKCDLVDEKLLSRLRSSKKRYTLLSCENKSGLPELLATMGTHLERLCGNPGIENPTITQERHRYHLKQCLDCLERYREYFTETSESARDLAIATHHLRNAVRSIGRITGSVETEEILDAIFSTFCIGK
ncbi:tRNA modification GTPase GTPBP3, mitochondrial [Anopheles darlingi]|uniref:tRNA modification GTPase GTPBP3, mitochondrial n=1 Tax=Anopheles darlingi TaxID=43151 RepID=UPI0021003151|nr:tRNA modification GTPase GTPBP3, mitochondrial [Anopheles darlingi]